jgi:peptidoglycan hydrolase-like protein with peptidoglycan-binding domain
MHKFTNFNPKISGIFSFDSFMNENKEPDIKDTNLAVFYKTLEDAITSKAEIRQEKYGSMQYNKTVETIQAALNFLGYDLPKHGVDGLFGPETGRAVAKFKLDHPIAVKLGRAILERAQDLIDGVKQAGGEIKNQTEISGGGEISSEIAKIIPNIVAQIEKLGIDVKITSGNDSFHHRLKRASRHATGEAIDFVISPNNSQSQIAVEQVIRNFMVSLNGLSYINEYTKPSAASTGGHFHVSYRPGQPENNGIGLVGPEYIPIPVKIEGSDLVSVDSGEVITTNFIKALIDMLKKRNFSEADIKSYTKPGTVALTSQEDEDFYKAILTSLGANVTAEKLKFLKAWRQAEGGKAKNNPFNTTKAMEVDGVTNYNSTGVKNYPDRQTGLAATVKTLQLPYYSELLTKLKNDSITADELANTDDLSTWGTGDLVAKVISGKAINPPPISS